MDCTLAKLALTLASSKCHKGDELTCAMDIAVHVESFFFVLAGSQRYKGTVKIWKKNR